MNKTHHLNHNHNHKIIKIQILMILKLNFNNVNKILKELINLKTNRMIS